jgi:hypothetical protein
MPPSDVAEQLQAQLETGLADFAPEFERLTLTNTTERWRSSSACQKSIRRGLAQTAMTFASALREYDAGYWWRRLPLAALEDVGHGNRTAVGMVLWAARNGRWRREQGDDRVLAFLVNELASGTKCRGCADLLFAPRVRAAVHRYTYQGLPADEWQPDPLVTFIEQAGQSVHAGMASAFAALAPLADLGPVTTECDELIELPRIGVWPSWSLDQYTSDGRKAASYFSKSCRPLAKLLDEVGVPASERAQVVGALIFRAEGELCDRRLAFPGSAEARREATRSGPRAVLGDRLEEAFEILKAHLPLLHHARCRVLGLAGAGPVSPLR